MEKEIHFYAYYNSHCIHGWRDTKRDIERDQEYIETTQMGLLSTDLLVKGYKVYIHDDYDDKYELKLGDCPRTDKEIRVANNLFKMWKAGAFRNKEGN